MFETVRRTVKEYGMIKPGDLILIAVSGGPDSMALLHCLHRLSSELQCQLKVVHVNHGLRAESEQEAAMVVEFCNSLGVEAIVRYLDPKKLKEGSLQELARDARRKIFSEELKTSAAARVALGHNANDQAETIIQRLIRGGGTGGLGGIHPVRDYIIRPLLLVRRKQIEQYINEEKIPFATDPTNLKPIYLRNKIRLELIPELEAEYNSHLVEALGKTALVLQEDDKYLNAQAFEKMGELVTEIEDKYHLDSKVYALPAPLSTRILRMLWGKLSGDPRGLTFDHVNRLLSFAATGLSGGCLELPLGVKVYKEQDGMLFCRGALDFPHILARTLEVPGETRVPELKIIVKARVVNNPDFYPLPEGMWSIVLNFEELHLPLKLRGRLPGDKILLGGSLRKLKEIFGERRIPIRLREKCLLVVQGNEVLWVPGLIRSDRAKVQRKSTRILELVAAKY